MSLKCLSPRLATDLLLTRGAIVDTPFAVAYSLTFSLVKNLKMLLQAKRQPGYKTPGRVDDRAYWFYDTNDKIGYEKLKEITWCCSWLFRYNLSDRCPPRKFPSIIKCKAFKSKMQVKDFKKNINVTIFNPNNLKILKRTWMLRYSIQTSHCTVKC